MKARLKRLVIISLVLTATLLMLCGTACNKGSSDKTASSELIYPSGWPDTNITAPPGSVRAQCRVIYSYKQDGDGYIVDGYKYAGEILTYAIAFHYDGGWDKAVAHLDEYLLSHGYNIEDEIKKHLYKRAYFDGKQAVQLLQDTPRHKGLYVLVIEIP